MHDDDDVVVAEERMSVARLTKDLALAAKTLSDDEARFLVDAYYLMQENRKRTGNQVRALGETKEPNSVLAWFSDQNALLENQIKRALDQYTDAHPMGNWLRQIYGIGPVLSAGLLAHINIAVCPTVGHIWRFAGLDPSVTWTAKDKAEQWVTENGLDVEKAAQHFGRNVVSLRRTATTNAKGEPVSLTKESLAKALARRPWNASLKTLCWKVGQSFMKFSGQEECVYGHAYRERKAYEIKRNDSGGNKELAAVLKDKVRKSTEAYKYLKEGVLPPGQIDARARRHAVKQFLSDLHGEWYRQHFGKEPPLPYPIAILGHAHLKKLA